MCKRKGAVFIISVAVLGQMLYLWWHSYPQEVWEYETVSRNLLNGKGFTIEGPRTGHHALLHPFYVFLCAGVYRLFGVSHRIMGLFQTVAFGSVAWITYRIGKKVFCEKTATLATLLVCLHPGLFVYTTHKLHPLIVDAFWFSLFLLFILEVRKKMDLKRAVFGGVILGLTLLSRSTILLFAGVAFLWLFKQWDFHWKRKVHLLATLLLVAVLVLTPWIVRNVILFGQFVPLTTTFGRQLWLGNNPNATGTPLTPSGSPVLSQDPLFFEEVTHLDELGQAKLFREAAVRHILAHPLSALQLFFKKFYYFWWFSPQSGFLYPPHWLSLYKLYYAGILGFGLIGIWKGYKGFVSNAEGITSTPLLFFLLSISMFQSIFFVEGRHRWAVEPILLVFSAEGMRLVWRKLRISS